MLLVRQVKQLDQVRFAYWPLSDHRRQHFTQRLAAIRGAHLRMVNRQQPLAHYLREPDQQVHHQGNAQQPSKRARVIVNFSHAALLGGSGYTWSSSTRPESIWRLTHSA